MARRCATTSPRSSTAAGSSRSTTISPTSISPSRGSSRISCSSASAPPAKEDVDFGSAAPTPRHDVTVHDFNLQPLVLGGLFAAMDVVGVAGDVAADHHPPAQSAALQ